MKIAVTGGIASGKSTLLQMLRERGVPTLSADAVARDILWNPDVQEQLMREFSVSDEISPVVLRGLISQGDDYRRAVNRIMHPVIAEELANSGALVIEVPLLFETCLHVAFDATWVAYCSRETQAARLVERYGGSDQFAPFSWQLDSKISYSFADSIIRTDSSKEESLKSLLQEAKRWGLPLAVS